MNWQDAANRQPFRLEGTAVLSYLLQTLKQTHKEQQELISGVHCAGTPRRRVPIHGCGEMMLDRFRRDQAHKLSRDWSSFDMGMGFLSHANEELRRLVCGLCPIQLAAGDLPKAIEYVIREIGRTGGPKIEFCHDIQDNHIPPRLQLAAFRIVQEALANACRHSNSESVLVGVNEEDGSLCIQVQDWGIGFDPANPFGRSLWTKGHSPTCQHAARRCNDQQQSGRRNADYCRTSVERNRK